MTHSRIKSGKLKKVSETFGPTFWTSDFVEMI